MGLKHRRNVGTFMSAADHAALAKLCAAAGITIAAHVRRCLDAGKKRLEREAKRRKA